MTTPTKLALRAAEELCRVGLLSTSVSASEVAKIIDRETALPVLLRVAMNNNPTMRKVLAVLRII